MRDGPPTYGTTQMLSTSLHGGANNTASTSSSIRSSSPLRPGGEYSSTSTLLQEISSLRGRLRELEDDGRSSVVSSVVDDGKESIVEVMLKKDVARVEQEKAMREKDFLNQMSTLQSDHQNRVNELHDKLRMSDEQNEDVSEALRKITLENSQLKEQVATHGGSDNKVLQQNLREAKKEISDLNYKLRRAAEDEKASKNSTEEKFLRLLEEQRESHVEETEKLMENLASADMDIAEGREEIDNLHAELEELQAYRETLLDEITTVRLDFTEEKRTVQSLKADLSEAKLTIEKLQREVKEKDVRMDQKFGEVSRLKKSYNSRQNFDKVQDEMKKKDETIAWQTNEIQELKEAISEIEGHKEMLLNEVTDMKIKTLTITTAPSSTRDSFEEPISPVEKEQLVKDMQGLEARLMRFHSTLADKDRALELEQGANAKLRAAIKTLQASSTEKSPHRDHSPSIARSNGIPIELATLRKENKVLIDEVKALRKSNANSSRKMTLAPAVVPLTASSRKAPARKNQVCPRTPVSGLVASFERRLGTSNNIGMSRSQSDDDDESLAPSFNTALESTGGLNDTLQYEKEKVEELQEQLREEKEVVVDLKKRLRMERNTVSELQAKMANRSSVGGSAGNIGMVAELRKSQQEVDRLKAKLRDSERDELNKLRSKDDERETRSLYGYDEEKKMDGDAEEITALRAQVVKKEKLLERLRSKHDEYEEASEETLERLRSQVEALEGELEGALTKIEALQNAVEDGDTSRAAILKQKKACETELSAIELELTTAKTNQVEATAKIKELQTKIEDGEASRVAFLHQREKFENEISTLKLELSTAKAQHADLVKEHGHKMQLMLDNTKRLEQSENIQADAQKNFDDQLDNLTTQLKNSHGKLNDLEVTYSIKIKDLENRIKSLEVELEEEKNEKESLKFDDQIDNLTNQLKNSQDKLNDLETEYSIKIKDLENRIKSLDAELEEEKKEKESFKIAAVASAQASPKMQEEFDLEINRLAAELTTAKWEKANSERDNLELLKNLENDLETLEAEADTELDAKQAAIDELNDALAQKEEEVKRLEDERTQLCHTMNDTSFNRKDDLEQLQAELLDLTNQTKNQAREIQKLKMTIEEHESRKGESNSGQKRRIEELEHEIAHLKHASFTTGEVDALTKIKAENEQLRESMREVKLERRQFKERLDSLTQDKSISRSSQILRDRNSMLKEEVEKLTKRLKKMEASITRFAI